MAHHATTATSAHGAATTMPDISVTHSLVQMGIALLVIVGCIWGLGKVLTRVRQGAPSAKRRSSSKSPRSSNGLTVLSRQSLGKDLSIASVRWGDREVLVGIAGSTITFLNDPTGPADSDAGVAEGASAGIGGPSNGTDFGSFQALVRPVVDPDVRIRRRGTPSIVEALRDATARR